jgi:hypothetical protein
MLFKLCLKFWGIQRNGRGDILRRNSEFAWQCALDAYQISKSLHESAWQSNSRHLSICVNFFEAKWGLLLVIRGPSDTNVPIFFRTLFDLTGKMQSLLRVTSRARPLAIGKPNTSICLARRPQLLRTLVSMYHYNYVQKLWLISRRQAVYCRTWSSVLWRLHRIRHGFYHRPRTIYPGRCCLRGTASPRNKSHTRRYVINASHGSQRDGSISPCRPNWSGWKCEGRFWHCMRLQFILVRSLMPFSTPLYPERWKKSTKLFPLNPVY